MLNIHADGLQREEPLHPRPPLALALDDDDDDSWAVTPQNKVLYMYMSYVCYKLQVLQHSHFVVIGSGGGCEGNGGGEMGSTVLSCLLYVYYELSRCLMSHSDNQLKTEKKKQSKTWQG